MALNKKCRIHGNEHPDFMCPEKECRKAGEVLIDRIKVLAKFIDHRVKFGAKEWIGVFEGNTDLILARYHFTVCEDCKARYHQGLEILNGSLLIFLEAYARQTLGLSTLYF